VDRVKKLIEPYIDQPGVIGIYLVGSATRPHRDDLSDYDIEVIVDDEVYDSTPDSERQTFFFKDGDPKVVDYEFYLIPWSDFSELQDSTLDLFHFPYQHALVLHDPQGRIAPMVKKLAELPENVRQDRMRVHFLEFLYRLGRARKTGMRGIHAINLSLLHGDALSALVKLLFLAKRSWPATKHWSEEELLELGIAPGLLQQISDWRSDPTAERAKGLIGAIKAFLDDCDETFHRDLEPPQQWLFFTKEGKRAFERWGER